MSQQEWFDQRKMVCIHCGQPRTMRGSVVCLTRHPTEENPSNWDNRHLADQVTEAEYNVLLALLTKMSGSYINDSIAIDGEWEDLDADSGASNQLILNADPDPLMDVPPEPAPEIEEPEINS